MPKIHLGVLDMPYADPDNPVSSTTGEVAEKLEEAYHVMRIFADRYMGKLAEEIEDRLDKEIDSIINGRGKIERQEIEFPKIEMMFRDFLDSNEIQGLLPTRIKRADMGESSRFKQTINAKGQVIATKKGKKKVAAPRQAFVDTGLYQASMRSWMDES